MCIRDSGYRVPSDEACEQVGESLEELRGDGGQLLFEPRRGAGEVMRLERFRAPVPAAP